MVFCLFYLFLFTVNSLFCYCTSVTFLFFSMLLFVVMVQVKKQTNKKQQLKVPQTRTTWNIAIQMQLILRYGVCLCQLWLLAVISKKLSDNRFWPYEKCEPPDRDWLEAMDLKVDSTQGQLSSFQHSVILLVVLPKNVFVKYLCTLKSTYCSAHLWKKEERNGNFHGLGPLECLSVFVPRLCDLA